MYFDVKFLYKNTDLYLVRNGKLESVEIRRTKSTIYPAAYLHFDQDFPPDEYGSSESMTEALARVNLSGVKYLVLQEHAHGCVILPDSNKITVVQTEDEKSFGLVLRPERIANAQKKTLRGMRQTCRILVRINDAPEIETVLHFGDSYNTKPVEDAVYLHPQGWFATDEVELVRILPWKK